MLTRSSVHVRWLQYRYGPRDVLSVLELKVMRCWQGVAGAGISTAAKVVGDASDMSGRFGGVNNCFFISEIPQRISLFIDFAQIQKACIAGEDLACRRQQRQLH